MTNVVISSWNVINPPNVFMNAVVLTEWLQSRQKYRQGAWKVNTPQPDSCSQRCGPARVWVRCIMVSCGHSEILMCEDTLDVPVRATLCPEHRQKSNVTLNRIVSNTYSVCDMLSQVICTWHSMTRCYLASQSRPQVCTHSCFSAEDYIVILRWLNKSKRLTLDEIICIRC